jgi:oligogalacturonide lyase
MPPAERLTRDIGNAQLLYFTGPSMTADGTRLVVLGDRDRPARGPYDPDAAVNVFVVDPRTGGAERLTDNRDGVARGYVTFGGRPGRGILPGSVALDAGTGVVVLVRDHRIARVSVGGGGADVLAELPPGTVAGYGAVSGDGRRYAIPVIGEAAFEDLRAIDATVRRLRLASRILVADVARGGIIDDIEVPDAWVTHVQFRPGMPETLLFNHEWADGSGTRRLWVRDRSGLRSLRRPDAAWTDAPVDPIDEVEHETWTADGSWIVYHGVHRRPGPLAGRAFVGRITIADGLVTELDLPDGPAAYGHLAARDAWTLVTDGIADPPTGGPSRSNGPSGAVGPVEARSTEPGRLDGADAPGEDAGGRWITRLDVDWLARRVVATPLVEHGSSWSSQDAHPHPVFDPTGRSVLFTSDRDGFRAVYRFEADGR